MRCEGSGDDLKSRARPVTSITFGGQYSQGETMNRSKAVFLIGSLVVLGACAHNAAVSTPVALKVTSKNAGKTIVSDVRKATLKAIGNSVPEARPLTVTVDLDVMAERVATSPFKFYDTGTSQQRTVASTGSNPQAEGALPTVEEHGFPAPTETLEEVTGVRMAYTISDAGGRVIESDHSRFELSPSSHIVGKVAPGVEPFSSSAPTSGPYLMNRNLVTAAADFLASRVKALSR
jgi:hypothetical protein